MGIHARRTAFNKQVKIVLRRIKDTITRAFTSKKEVTQGDKNCMHVYSPSRHLSKDLWYRDDADLSDILTEQVRDFYADYTGLEGFKLESRLLDIRSKAWQHGYYPDFGGMWFAKDTIRSHPLYRRILQRLKSGGARLLNLGPGLGQDLRHLAHDGAPTERMLALGCDRELWRLGEDLFLDTPAKAQERRVRGLAPVARFDAQFHHLCRGALAVWAPPAQPEPKLEPGYWADVVVANHFFTTLGWCELHGQLALVAHLSRPGTILMGVQLAAEDDFVYLDDADVSIMGVGRGIAHSALSAYWTESLNRHSSEYPSCRWELVVAETVDLREWGMDNREWQWIKNSNERGEGVLGIYYAFERIE